MGFLNKPREKNLKALSKERKKPLPAGGKAAANALANANANAENENTVGKPKKLLNFFLKNPEKLPPSSPTSPTSAHNHIQVQPPSTLATPPTITTPINASQVVPTIVNTSQFPIPIRLPEPIKAAAPPVAPPASSSPLMDWHISDVVFLVEGKRIPTHKVVLISRCAYFAALFRDTPPGAVSTIEVSEFSHHIFSRFIRLVYGGKKDNIVLEDVSELIRCANYYQATEIAIVCQEVANEAAAQAEAELQAQVLQAQYQYQHQYQHQQQEDYQTLQQQQQLQQQQFQHQQHQQLQQQQFQHQHQQPQMIEQNMFSQAMDDAMMTQFSTAAMVGNELYLGTENNNSIGDLVSDSPDNFGGMSVWSNDPVLATNGNDSFETTDAYRIVEIY